MNKKELKACIDREAVSYEKECRNEIEREEFFGDAFSDTHYMYVERQIALYALSLGHDAIINGNPLSQMLKGYSEEDYDEEIGKITSDDISDWIAYIDGSGLGGVELINTPHDDLKEIIEYYFEKFGFERWYKN